MSFKSILALSVSAAFLAISAPSFAASSTDANFIVPGSPAVACADAAAFAARQQTATKSDIATCTRAIDLAAFQPLATRMSFHDVFRAAALTNRATLYLARAEYDNAIADSSAALQLDGRLTEAMVNRGVALLELHRASDADADFSRAIALSPAHQEKIYFDRAMAREDMGDKKGAYADYRQASALAPNWDAPKKELARFKVKTSVQ